MPSRSLGLSALLLSSVLACSPHVTAPAAPAKPEEPLPDNVVRLAAASRAFIRIEPVTAQAGAAVLRAPARVVFSEGAFAQVGAPLSGRVVEVHVKTGDRVRAGDPLITLNSPEAASVRSSLTAASAALREAKAALDRETLMLKQGVGTERDKLTAEIRFSSAQAELQRAQATTGFVGQGGGGMIVLRAPITGIILTRKATVGAAVSSGGEALVEVGDPAALWIAAEVFDRDVPQVREGQRAKVELSAFAAPLTGRVRSIGAVVSDALRTTPVRIVCEGDLAGLRPGMYGRVQLLSDEPTLTVPARAVLITEAGDTIVYVARDAQTFERRHVTIGPAIEGRVRVLAHLQAGEQIVTQGALLLDGSAQQVL